jgi:tetratricopeptide (TPR) repeat protein|tara:strand:+ start:326 stop:1030 length:705 start_codon:yes stop_codon:yes gene_type:complete
MNTLKHTLIIAIAFVMQIQSQNNSELLAHYKIYYKQMQKTGDIQGIVNAMTHLSILEPNVKRQDTLAYIYVSEGKHRQALSLLGAEVNESDSDLETEIKAISLKSLNEPKRSIEHYEVLYKRSPTVLLAYELAELKIQTNDLTGAGLNITYGMANSTTDMMKIYYEMQSPYQVPLMAGFMYLKAIAKFTENTETNHDAALAILNETLELAPNFNLATIAVRAIQGQKQSAEAEE